MADNEQAALFKKCQKNFNVKKYFQLKNKFIVLN